MSSYRFQILFVLPAMVLFILACQDTVNTPVLEFDEPRLPAISLFDLDYDGMESGSAARTDMMDFGRHFDLNADGINGNQEWNPVSTALMFIHDYFRIGMMNNLRGIYNSTFDMGENLKPDQDGDTFSWRYRTGVYNPDRGMPLVDSDVTLIADVGLEKTVEWSLYRDLYGEEILIATGFHNQKAEEGEWLFYHHNELENIAFSFHWERLDRQTVMFDATLHFVGVSSRYERQEEWIKLALDMQDSPESPVYTEIHWNRISGEGYIDLVTNEIDELKCWDENKEELDVCSGL